MNRSLAALAGERDRALRALAAEEERRCKVVDDVSRLLGDELTAGDVSRVTMGLEVLEREQQEQEGGEDERDGPYGRAWLLGVRRGWMAESTLRRSLLFYVCTSGLRV